MSLPYRWRNRAAVLALVVGLVLVVRASARQTTFYIDQGNPKCSDTGSGTQAIPYCTMSKAATVANPGDTFLVSGPKHGGAPVTFTRPGTAANPITWRAVGTVAVAAFIDVNDATFTPSGTPNVWQIPWTLTSGKAYQTFFDDIVVDDPNQTYFTLKDEDGPLVMTPVLSEAEVAAHDGTFFRDAANQRMLVHPYGNRTPSTTNTDIVIATGNSMTLDTKANYQVFDGFTITYAGGVSGLILSSNNKFYNTRYIATPLNIYGNNNYFENTTINHGIWRQGPAWDWDQEGEGATGGFSAGTGHVMKNLHVFNSWNSTFNSETSNGNTIDGGRFHGAPNHCTGAGNGGNTVRNAAWWNCQDYQWLFDPVGIVMEHVVIPGGGVAVSAIEGNTGPITIRNSILSGVMHFVRGTGAAADLPYEGCTWEVGSLLEYNVIAEGMTIERCNTQIAYPIDEYVARCASGEFTGCMTIRNNIKVPGTTAGWKTVMVDGMWSGVPGSGIGPIGEQWNFQLVPGSPAINAGMVSGAATDLIGITRPQPVGGLYDIGAYEFTPGGDPAPTGKPIVAAPAAVTTTITAPTSAATYDAGTSATLTTLAGTSKSGRTITGCTWANSLGGSGSTSGTTSWTIASVALTVGSNVITVTCTNDGKTTGADIITVTRSGGAAVNPISANRLPDGDTAIPNPTWASAGATIVNRTTQCGSTITAGSSIATLNTAITNCPANQFVLLGAGSFTFAGSINMKSNVTVRGSGANSTLITFTGGGCTFQGHVCFDGDGATYMNNPRFSTNWTAGYTRGTTQITLADASNVQIGYVLFLDQLDNSTTDPFPVPWYCEVQITCIVSGIDKGGGSRDGRFHHQEVRVTAKTGNLVTVTPAIMHTTWSSGRDPEAWFGNATITGAGLENLSVQGSGSTNHIISMTGATNSWVKGVRSIGPARSHVWMQIASHLTIRDSYFFNTASHASQSYGVEHMGASSNLIENNIFQYVTAPIVFNGGVGSVVGYNFTVNNVYDSVPTHEFLFGGLWTHAGGVDYNLWEGNDTPGYQSDVQHAGSNFQTLLRNYLWGRERTQQQNTNPIYTRAQNRFHNILGNVLGITGYHTQYEFTPSSGGNQHLSIYQLGVGYTGDGPANDANVKNSLLRWGNWDVVTSTADNTSGDQTGVRWCGTSANTGWSTRCGSASEVPTAIGGNFQNTVPSAETVPNSLYLSAKPAFFGAGTWPPIGPDVSGGSIANLGGHVYEIPARACYFTTMGGTLTGTTALPFTCTY